MRLKIFDPKLMVDNLVVMPASQLEIFSAGRVAGPIDDFFNAILKGDVLKVKEWFHLRMARLTPFDEAGLDLARRLRHAKIVHLIEDELSITPFFPGHNNPLQTLHTRTKLTFNRDYYFSELVLETYTDGSIEFYVCYKTHLQYPYLREPLLKLGAKEFQALFFSYQLGAFSGKNIADHFEQVIATLTRHGKKDGTEMASAVFSPLHEALEAFFVAPKNNLRNECDLSECSYEKESTTYEAYLMYDAAIHFNYKEMHRLLRNGANPDNRFDQSTILWIAAHQGADNAVDKRSTSHTQNKDAVLKTIKILLQYGASPSLETYGETLMEFLIKNHQDCDDNKKDLYQKIIKYITAHHDSKPHVSVHPGFFNHPNFAESYLAEIVNQANMEMLKKSQYYQYNDFEIEDARITFIMKDKSLVTVESKNIEDVSLHEYNQLFHFFFLKRH